ncbi:hypothetical protein [Pseudomonas abietaniphila]|uniref:hypothetical protein n=1 Tax=Pseudomonas abietaniphila TaxID=89065 RepID=UPI0007853AFB|nr:hypothetical protein [Pseudomonas abietaniphila]
MTPERFAQLADAYGANLNHWPEAVREDARRLIATGDSRVSVALDQAAWLDKRLDTHQAAQPDVLLMQKIVASAFAVERRSFWARYSTWLPSMGFVGVGLAGIAAGMLVVSLSLPLTGTPDVLPSVFDHGDADLMLSLDVGENEQ